MFTNIAKKFALTAIALASLFFAACSSITNITPDTVPENPSRTYTLSMSAYINDGSIIQKSIDPIVVIDGTPRKMKAVSELEGKRFYEYEYTMPTDRQEAKYYFTLKYKSDMGSNGIVEKQIFSRDVYKLQPATRYVMSLQYDRGPVGAVIPVLGRGFDKLDKVYIGGVLADTKCISRTTLNFTVPSLQAGQSYDVEVRNNVTSIWVGQFRIDSGNLLVSPAQINIESGESLNMVFDLGFKAPEGGFEIDVKTNIPSSIVMPEVVVPTGKSSVVVPVKFTVPAKGALYINAKGFNEKIVPISVNESGLSEISIEVKKDAKEALETSVNAKPENASQQKSQTKAASPEVMTAPEK